MRGARRALALGGAAFALAGSAFAADQIAGRDRAPAAATVTIASTAPLFQEAGLVGGQQLERCTVLTNEGPQPADVTLFGSAAQADLSPWLNLELVRGTLPGGGPAGDCTGFVPDAADYGGGDVGVVFRGTLAELPASGDGIADPTRWAVGEHHAYLLRIDYTGDDPQQGLSTVQDFSWGATPFDDRGPETFVDPSSPPPGGTPADPGAGGAIATPAGKPSETIPIGRQCTVISFPTRSYIGARAISRPTKVRKGKSKATKASAQPLSSTEATVVSAAGPDLGAAEPVEAQRRSDLLAYTARTGARRTPVLVVRLAPGKGDTLAVRVGLRKNGSMTSPKRWRWVRIRINATATKSTLKWPFTATAKMGQLKVGYNQLDLTLNRGATDDRIKGLPRLMRRSFAFVVGAPGSADGSSANCTLG